MSVYIAKRGSALTDEEANKYGQRIEALLSEKRGRITPRELIEDGRKRESPLHDYFEWDDEFAASEYRVEQARYLLRSITIKREEDEKEIRAFHNVIIKSENVEERAYASVTRIMSEEELRNQLLAQALRELEAWQTKYEALQEFADLFLAIRLTRERIAVPV